MALIPIETLIAGATADQVKASVLSLLAKLGLPVTSWHSGAPTRLMVAVISKVFEIMPTLMVTITKSGFLDDAETTWLTRLAALVYNVERIEETFVQTDLTIVNGSLVVSYDPGDLIVKNSTTGKTFTNVAAFSLIASETETIVIRALEAGSASNSAAGQINAFVTPLTGATCTNPSDAAALDAEEDEPLRVRCRAKLASLSPNGAAAAYEYVALTPSLNGNVSINRVKVPTAPGNGTLQVIVAGPSGVVSAGNVALVQTAIDKYAEPLAVTATVASATALPVTYAPEVWVSRAANLTNAEWLVLIQDALKAYIDGLPIGGVELTPGVGIVPWRSIVGVIEAIKVADVSRVLSAKLASEADTSVGATQVVTFDPVGGLTLTLHQV